ncbi:MAG: exosortase-associated EpsI family protein [Phycisphaerae bacterium]|nr:MAG: exosortase-associated EpsI family protein [Planctomycetota bacterium]KAB2943795.1 MAG: exosortase-associated EpsI family protein [Phycisphaerae bacterium]MBE7458449.1 exosortase-associated EpsI family protein [Planctomycetia bacterium]MCK6464920.1 EpsI family protein [Phycisphaerae bacterium]MCL4719191.1 exosortase-associated EpsI family protein [Phycisphaerae bacterium]
MKRQDFEPNVQIMSGKEQDQQAAAAPNLPGSGASAGTSIDGRRRAYFSAPLVIVLVLLGGGALVQGPLERWLEVVAHKEAVPLRAALGSLDREALGPYRFVRAEFLTPEYVEALGTDQYLIWTLEDTREAPDSSRRQVHLFVTYYTGGPELVVHRPDECFRASGYTLTEFRRDERLRIDSLGGGGGEIPFRIVTFRKTGLFQQAELSVAYTLYCNGRFTVSPTEVRMWTTSPATRSAYFSKVEVCFLPSPGESGPGQPATADETLQGTGELMRYVLPLLMNDIWPSVAAPGALSSR